jgi:thiamine-phosphate pyrophosphorylase
MKLELSPAMQLAFDRARQLALRDSAAEVVARHLLAGLLAEEEGKAAALLLGAGAHWPSVQAHVGLPVQIDASMPPDLPLHPVLERVMAAARELAVHHGEEGSVSTAHVLLALMTADAAIQSQFKVFGLDFEKLHFAVVGDTAPLVMDEPLFAGDPAVEVNTGRILDAAANRAREAVRVLEDYTRFALDDAFLSRLLKQLRHDFAAAIQLLPSALLLEARDTPGDVGAAISTAAEWQRQSLEAVVQANAKRLQEALRSLEEYGKVLSSEFAERVEQLRYASYTLERALVQGRAARDRLASTRLCVLVTDALCRASLVGTVKEAILGGAQMIQLREKDMDDRTFLARARDLRKLTRDGGVLLIINDRPDIARLCEADGVHLGQDDLPIHEARRILGHDALIGVSTHNLEQVRRAVLEGASYLGVGPTFPSQTKKFDALAGLEFVKNAVAETSLPAFAIGGINLDNISQVIAAGAKRVAVSNAVCVAADPRAAAAKLCQHLSV